MAAKEGRSVGSSGEEGQVGAGLLARQELRQLGQAAAARWPSQRRSWRPSAAASGCGAGGGVSARQGWARLTTIAARW